MQLYNSGRMLIHGHRRDKSSVFALAHCMGVWVLVLQVSLLSITCLLYLKVCSIFFLRFSVSVSLQVYKCLCVDRHACKYLSKRVRVRACVYV